MKIFFQEGRIHKSQQSGTESSTDAPCLHYRFPHHDCELHHEDQGSAQDIKTKHIYIQTSLKMCIWLVLVVVLYLWYEVQESISWECSHCQAHKQLQDKSVGLLTGVKKHQTNTQHGAHCDDQDSSCAVAVLCRKIETLHFLFKPMFE